MDLHQVNFLISVAKMTIDNMRITKDCIPSPAIEIYRYWDLIQTENCHLSI